MSSFETVSVKTALLCAVFLVTSCASVGNESADINDCRKIAYGDHYELLGNDANVIFSQCKVKKDALRADANKKETTFIWVEFFLDLFVPSNSPNK
ncbi:hypothetical protein [Colwellia psychrerythraea]|uniref:Lipoprotein n=1 Tax=Colwellia psychrerythraea TaxID=28229 RepID=A0A099K8T0_COLPS|nr:hypothetical protein [Colwellia psychrerythraea]KGJ86776.1 hypothetical protein ND2E_0948 [Colwellia psychrerythraea]